MAYQVIARKWRPQTFEEVTGQEPITRTLRNAIEHERLHHAYLFSGARGVGKTTTARLLAKALNCHRSPDRPTPAPCRTTDADQCPSCREIAEGRSIDVLEIDAASNTGVDNVRDAIINTVGVRPARDRFKVFIIDEVHMLSTQAFNALLKTLEEPPPRVVFIMATTESHKIPDTILSRSQQFEFRTIAAARIVERLRLIADAEKIDVADDALREIARAGEGSMRDAQSAFDQVISFSTGRIEVRDVETALGIAGAELRARVMRAVAEGAPAETLAVVEDLVMRGHDLRNFCRDLLAHARDLLVVKVAGESVELTDATEAERRALAQEAVAFSESDLVRFFHSLTETEKALRESAHPRYQLEVGLVKLVEMRRVAPLGQILERLNALEESLRTGRAPAGSAPPSPPAPAAAGGSSSSSGTGGASRRGTSGVARSSSSSADNASASSSVPDETSTVQERVAPPTQPQQDGADVPPFEPLPPRTTAGQPKNPLASIPTLPPRASVEPQMPVEPTPPPSPTVSTASIPSLPSRTKAEPTRQPTTSAATPVRPIPSLPPRAVDAPASTPSGLKLVPPPTAAPASGVAAPAASAPATTHPPPSFFEPLPAERTVWDEPARAADPSSDNAAPPSPYAATTSPARNSSPASVPPPTAPSPAGVLDAAVEQVKKLLDERRKPFLVTALEGARVVRFEGDELYVEYAPEGKHLRDALAKPDNVKLLREVCRAVAGRDTGVRIVVSEAGEGDDNSPPTRQDEERLEQQRLREMAEQHPAVQKLLRTFRAEIIDVRRVEPDAQ